MLLQLQQAARSSNGSGTSNSQLLGTPRSTDLLQKNQMETMQSCFSLLKAHRGKSFPQGRATGQFCQATVTTGPGAPAEPAPLPALRALFPVLPPPAPCRRAGLFFLHPEILQPQHILKASLAVKRPISLSLVSVNNVGVKLYSPHYIFGSS